MATEGYPSDDAAATDSSSLPVLSINEICSPDDVRQPAEHREESQHTSEEIVHSCVDEMQVNATSFSGLPPGQQAEEKPIVLSALEKHSKWHRKVHSLIPQHGIKLSCAVNAEQGLIAAHLTLHNDFKLIKLGRDCGFPRGFCVVVDAKTQTLVGQGTFYPKFANDDRNSGFSVKDFGGVSKISCFIKYSGSTGIISIIRDNNGVVTGWTGSSKNSCNHVAPPNGISYPAATVSVFRKYATQDFISWCQEREVHSIGLEVFIAEDQSHGYGYGASGCIVTSICARCSADGRPVYLNPAEMYTACCEVGLPTDRPICIEGKANIQSFVEALSNFRDLLTLGALRRVLHEHCGIELETLHDRLIDSEIVEGFVIRRWKDDVEIESVKFKIWLYQMVTQVLRPSLSTKGSMFNFSGAVPSLKSESGAIHQSFCDRVKSEMKRWCVLPDAATRQLCLWVIYAAAEACLPEGHPQLLWSAAPGSQFPAHERAPGNCAARDPARAYWITLGDYAVAKLVAIMDEVGWNAKEAAALVQTRFDIGALDIVAEQPACSLPLATATGDEEWMSDPDTGEQKSQQSKRKGKAKHKGNKS
jgi:hypothetical protein